MAPSTAYFAGDSRTNRERMLAGDLCIADDRENGRRAQRAVQLACAYHQAEVAGDNVWLGGGVIVCPSVTIGDNGVIGTGSVVTRDIPANIIAVGNPTRVLREI